MDSSISKIPSDFVNYKSSPLFDIETTPKMLLHHHNTKAGVYGEIIVKTGSLKFFGFHGRHGEIENESTIVPGQPAISPPQYWHKVELLSKDTKFQINFYAQKDSDTVKENQSERANSIT